MRRFSMVYIVLVLVYGCADRKYENPLDPLNEETKGKPVGLEILSFGKKVVLSWQSIDVDGFIGMKVFRQTNPDSVFQEIRFISNQSYIEDGTVDYGNTYTYRIQAITEEYQSPYSNEISITPGPSYIWVTSGANGGVYKLTHDASHLILQRGDFLYPYGVTSAGYDRGVWISDYYLDQVVRLTENGKLLNWISGFKSALDIDYDPVQNQLWVADSEYGKVFAIDTVNSDLSRSANFNEPIALSVDLNSGSCWVADPKNKEIALIDPISMQSERFTNFIYPEHISANSTEGTCWIADSSRVIKMDKDGTRLITVTDFQWAIAVAVYEQTDECWVIDWSPKVNNTKIVKLSSSGSKIVELPGFTSPQSLDVDPYDGSCLVADTWNYRVVKLSPEGKIIGQYQLPTRPFNIRVVTQ